MEGHGAGGRDEPPMSKASDYAARMEWARNRAKEVVHLALQTAPEGIKFSLAKAVSSDIDVLECSVTEAGRLYVAFSPMLSKLDPEQVLTFASWLLETFSQPAWPKTAPIAEPESTGRIAYNPATKAIEYNPGTKVIFTPADNSPQGVDTLGVMRDPGAASRGVLPT